MHNFKEQLHLKITRQTCCATAQCIYIVAVSILYLYLLVQDLFVHFILLLWYQKVLDSDSDCFIESPGCCCCWSASWRCDWSVGLMSTLLPPVWRSLTLYPLSLSWSSDTCTWCWYMTCDPADGLTSRPGTRHPPRKHLNSESLSLIWAPDSFFVHFKQTLQKVKVTFRKIWAIKKIFTITPVQLRDGKWEINLTSRQIKIQKSRNKLKVKKYKFKKRSHQQHSDTPPSLANYLSAALLRSSLLD